MLERLLAFRLRRLLAGEPRPGDWPALARILRRSRKATPSVCTMAVTVRRPLHLHLAQTIAVRIDFDVTNAGLQARVPARVVPRLVVRTFSARLALPAARGDIEGASATTATVAETSARTLVQSVPRVTTVVSRIEQSPQRRAERWLAHHEQRRNLRLLVTSVVRPSAPATLPFSVEFAAPHRVLSRPGPASSAPLQMAPATTPLVAGTDGAPRYWTDSRAAASAPVATPDLNLLTDNVLRTVDQRLVAARERLSQVTKG